MSQGVLQKVTLLLVVLSLAGFAFATAKVLGLGSDVEDLSQKVSGLKKSSPAPAQQNNVAGQPTGTEPVEGIETGVDTSHDEIMRQMRELAAKVDELSRKKGGASGGGSGESKSDAATDSSSSTTSTAGAGGGEVTAASLLSSMTEAERATFKATVKEAIEEMEQEERAARMDEMTKRLLDEITKRLDLQPHQTEAVGALMQEQMDAMRNLWRGEGLTNDQRREQMTTMMTQTDEKMKALLTPTQFETYTAWRQETGGRMMG
ncbi:MAG: hypothetical protein RDV41_15795, partial [Planctomycetota bacterium]|nr:hypothetical protein [Planctomycetota bacterium]